MAGRRFAPARQAQAFAVGNALRERLDLLAHGATCGDVLPQIPPVTRNDLSTFSRIVAISKDMAIAQDRVEAVYPDNNLVGIWRRVRLWRVAQVDGANSPAPVTQSGSNFRCHPGKNATSGRAFQMVKQMLRGIAGSVAAGACVASLAQVAQPVAFTRISAQADETVAASAGVGSANAAIETGIRSALAPVARAKPRAPEQIRGAPAGSANDPARCVAPAAEFHHVNGQVLAAILRVESRMKEQTITRNSNGSIDVGMGGMNSIHFRELGRFGIAPGHLLDGCIATYVSAWHLSKQMAKHGNTWFGIASYHSATPYYNWRYQVMLHNELVRLHAVSGSVVPVPGLGR